MRLAAHGILPEIGSCWMSCAPGNRGAPTAGPIPLTKKSVIIATHQSLLPEQLVVTASVLEEGNLVVGRLYHQPIAGVRHVALVPPDPTTAQAVHVVAAFESLQRLGGILQHQVDELLQLS